MSATVALPHAPVEEWKQPSRGIVGMACLIVAESAIFIIFVVAYLFYIGKSLTGPTPREVLDIPWVASICLLSSSITVHFAVHDLRANRVARSAWWLAGTSPSRKHFSRRNGTGVVRPHLSLRPHRAHQSIRNHFLFARWPACLARHRRPDHARSYSHLRARR